MNFLSIMPFWISIWISNGCSFLWIKKNYYNFFSILTSYKPSQVWILYGPTKVWACSVQPLWCLSVNKQTDKQSINICNINIHLLTHFRIYSIDFFSPLFIILFIYFIFYHLFYLLIIYLTFFIYFIFLSFIWSFYHLFDLLIN